MRGASHNPVTGQSCGTLIADTGSETPAAGHSGQVASAGAGVPESLVCWTAPSDPVYQEPIVKLTVWAAVESPPTKTSIVVVSMPQSLVAAFQ